MIERFADRYLAALNLVVLTVLLAFALVGCNGVSQSQADNIRAQVQALCGTAMSLAPLAGPYAIWITAGCGSAEAVADLATKPGAVAYLNTIIAKVKAASTPLM
jgi:hypothetical protein